MSAKLPAACGSCGNQFPHCAEHHCTCPELVCYWHGLYNIALCDKAGKQVLADNFWADKIFLNPIDAQEG